MVLRYIDHNEVFDYLDSQHDEASPTDERAIQ